MTMMAWQLSHYNELSPSGMGGRRLPWVFVALTTALVMLAMELGMVAMCVLVWRTRHGSLLEHRLEPTARAELADPAAQAELAAQAGERALGAAPVTYGALIMRGHFCAEARSIPAWSAHIKDGAKAGSCRIEGVLFRQDNGGYIVRRDGMALNVPTSALPTHPKTESESIDVLLGEVADAAIEAVTNRVDKTWANEAGH